MRYVVIENSKVINIIIANHAFSPLWVQSDEAGIGWSYDNETFLPPAPEQIPVVIDPCEFLIDKGPFADRLYPYTLSVDMSTDPRVIAINKDLSRREYINLKDPRVATTLGFLAGDVTPGLGTLEPALITQEVKTFALTNPVSIEENRSLRVKLFKGFGT